MEENRLRSISAKMMLLTLSWGNFQISGLYFFIIFQVLYCVLAFITLGSRFRVRSYKLIYAIIVINFITLFSGLFSELPESFRNYSLIMTLVLIPSFVAFFYLMKEVEIKTLSFSDIIKWIKYGFFVQLVYIPFQMVLFKGFGIDLNKLFFKDLLNLMDNATFIREGVWFPSGFTWHSAYLAPMLVLSIALFRNNYIRLLVLLDSFICGNSTALVGVLIVVSFMAFREFFNVSDVVKRRRMIEIATILCLIGLYVFGLGGMNQIVSKIQYLIYRIGFSGSSSSKAHYSYYLLYPIVINKHSIFTNLFGTGYASSGYSFTQINGQYSHLRHWAVESDYIDILVSRGIIGFVFYYGFLIYNAIKGRKISIKYTIVLIAVMMQGFSYNVQFEYFFFIELLIYGFIAMGYSIFEDNQKKIGIIRHQDISGAKELSVSERGKI